MSDPEDVLKFRAGYYAGLRLVEEIAEGKGLSVKELLKIPRGEFEKAILGIVKQE